MTKKELSQLYYLNREIEVQQRRLKELEDLASNCTIQITGMPRRTDRVDRVGKYAAEIADLKVLLDLSLKKCFIELHRLNDFIESVPDSEMRIILSLRYVNRLSWEEVARSISPYASEDSVRKAHDRFLNSIKS